MSGKKSPKELERMRDLMRVKRTLWRARGLCSCGKRKAEHGQICDECRAKSTARYARRVGKAPAAPINAIKVTEIPTVSGKPMPVQYHKTETLDTSGSFMAAAMRYAKVPLVIITPDEYERHMNRLALLEAENAELRKRLEGKE